MTSLLFSVFILTLSLPFAFALLPLKPCAPRSACSCENVDGLINLHPLANNNRTARFENIPDPDGDTFYSWNPCYGFDELNCMDTAVCQIYGRGSSSFSLGPQSSLVYVSSSEYGIVFQYTQWGGKNNSGNIIMTCDASEEGKLIRRPDADFGNEYYLELKSKYACPQSNGSTTTDGPTTQARRKPTTPAFIGPARTPTTTAAPLLDLFSLGWLVIGTLFVLLVLLTVTTVCFCSLHSRLSSIYTVETKPNPGYGSHQALLVPRV